MHKKKKRSIRMLKDDLVWEQSDEMEEEFEASFLKKVDVYRSIASFVEKHRPGRAKGMGTPIAGGFNIVWRVDFDDGGSASFRVPKKNGTPWPYEKIQYEVATMRYIMANTTIPVPKVYHYGTAEENPTGLGPFMIIEWIEHQATLDYILRDPKRDKDEFFLNPEIEKDELEKCWRQISNILLQLYSLKLPRLGSLMDDKEGIIKVNGRPLTRSMGNLIVHGGIPPCLLPPAEKTYESTDEWYRDSADMHLIQLLCQHNDSIDDPENQSTDPEDNIRDRYVARQLFRHLAKEGRLTKSPCEQAQDDFRLYSEDFNPGNILMDKDLHIVGVIDWEFVHSAPSEYTASPPWWLLLEDPQYWSGGFSGWMSDVEPQFWNFHRILEEEERNMTQPSDIGTAVNRLELENSDQSLSVRMKKNWQNRTWLLLQAMRNSWLFDNIFWNWIDDMFFEPPNETGERHTRMHILTLAELEAMEPFVKGKVEEHKDRRLVAPDIEDLKRHLAKVLL